jgi:hypothetical protein
MKLNLPIRLALALAVSIVFISFRIVNEDLVDKIIEKLRVFANTYPREKAYLHLDRETYSVGDTLWFKAYLVDG